MKLRSRLPLCVSIILLVAGMGVASAQDPVQPPEGVTPDSDWLYGKHLEQVQGTIMKEADLNLRVQKLENFTKKLPAKAKILPYMEGFFLQTADELQKAGKAQEANAVVAKVTQLFPNSPTVKTQAFHAAYQKKDYAKAIELGEQLNAANPSPEMTAMLAQAYMATKNGPKAAEYSQKLLDAAGPKNGALYLLYLAEYYLAQDPTKATGYYNQFLEAFPGDAPPAGWNADLWSKHKATAFALKADAAYKQKDYAGAIQNFSESLKFAPHNDTAYLIIGLCHWRGKDLDKAEQSFAKAVVLNKPASAKAREYLEQIWKPRHNNTLDGLDALLEKAKAELKL